MIYNEIGYRPLIWKGIHRIITITVGKSDGGINIIRVLPDTGAFLTLIRSEDLKYTDFEEEGEENSLLVGGSKVYYTSAKLSKLYLGKLQLHGVRIGITEDLDMNLLGANVLECVCPWFDYTNNRMYYLKNNGIRPLAQAFPDLACGTVYSQNEFDKQNVITKHGDMNLFGR